MRYVQQYESDTTPSSAVVKEYRKAIFASPDREENANLALVHYRGGNEEFVLGRSYCASNDPGDRATGADILAQLGWNDRTFLAESVQILIPLLEDPDDRVVYASAVALGHRGDPAAIPALLKLIGHPNPQVRQGVAFGLLGHEDPHSIAAMIILRKTMIVTSGTGRSSG